MCLKVAYVLRQDALNKSGGDSGKVKKYKFFLDDLGFVTKIFYGFDQFLESQFSPDVVHIFNLQTPYENIRAARWCVGNKVPYVLSTIHHQKIWMEKYFSLIRFPKLSRIVGFNSFDWLNSFVKELLVFRRLSNLIQYLQSPRTLNRYILENASLILPLSHTEHKHIKSDFDKVRLPEERIIVNALTHCEDNNLNSEDHLREGLVVVGRIEPRKNQLKIAKALKNSQYKVTFIGKKNMVHSKYVEEFEAVVLDSENLQYAGQKNQDELKRFYLNSKVSLSNSWFEVVSQVDLEALSCGCNIIVTMASAIDDYFESKPITISPLCSDVDILKLVDRAYREVPPKFKHGNMVGWDKVALSLIKVYKEVVL